MLKIKLLLKNKDLQKRFFYTAFILTLIRCLTQISVPWVDIEYLKQLTKASSVFSFYNVFTGGGLENFSIFAMSISPYISASIILQLGAIVIPSIEQLQKEGEYGGRILNRYTRNISLVFAILQSTMMGLSFGHQGVIMGGWLPVLTIAVVLTASSSILIWLGGKITEKGLGNGISLILLTNMASRIPSDLRVLYRKFVLGKTIKQAIIAITIITLIIFVIILLTIIVNSAIRKIPVHYVGKLKGDSLKGVDESIPLKVNTGNVMPIVFATSILATPSFVLSLFRFKPKGLLNSMLNSLVQTNWFVLSMWKLSIGYLIYIFLIVFFAYFYMEIVFSPIDVSNNLKRSGAVIPDVRPGEETERYIKTVSKPIILIGAIMLALLCTIPLIFSGVFGVSITFGGTSLIIIVSVLFETVKQSEVFLEQKDSYLFKTKE